MVSDNMEIKQLWNHLKLLLVSGSHISLTASPNLHLLSQANMHQGGLPTKHTEAKLISTLRQSPAKTANKLTPKLQRIASFLGLVTVIREFQDVILYTTHY